VGGLTPSGALISVGTDCTTQQPAVEVWQRASLQSTILPSPCAFGEADPIPIEMPDGSLVLYGPGTCLLRYDGSSVEDESPPGEVVQDLDVGSTRGLPSLELRGRLTVVGKRLWTRQVATDPWEPLDAGPCEGKSLVQVATDGYGVIWLSCGGVVRRQAGGWRGVAVPDGVEVTNLVRTHDARVVAVGNGGTKLLAEGEPKEAPNLTVLH